MDEKTRPEGGLQEAIFTERVRIVGADQAGATVAAEAASEHSVSTVGGRLFETNDDDVVAELLATPELPHWTEPPTGQVPAVLTRKGDEAGSGDSSSQGSGPVWREHSHEWEDTSFEPSLLADEGTRQGQLDEAPLEERRPWEFDGEEDLDATADLPVVVDLQDDLGGLGGPDDPRFTPEGEVDDQWTPPSDADRDSVTGFSTEADAPGQHPAPHWSTIDGPADGDFEATDAARPSSLPSSGDQPRGVRSISSSPLRSKPQPPPGTRRVRGNAPDRPQERQVAKGPSSGSARTANTVRRSSGRTGRNLPVAISTGVGVAILAIIAFQVGTVATLVLVSIVIALALAECYAALRRSGFKPASLLGLVSTIVLMFSVYAKGLPAFPLVIGLFAIATMVWYIVGADHGFPVEGITSTVFGFLWIGVLGSFAALILAPAQFPDRHGIAFLFGAVAASVGADVGALIAGSLAGKHLISKEISPHKTWEGVIGGAVLAVALSVLLTGHISPWTPGKAAILGVVAAVLSPLGDLCESLVKRDIGVKDMGNLLPGHGGILDRFDGMLFVLPATYYLVRILHLG